MFNQFLDDEKKQPMNFKRLLQRLRHFRSSTKSIVLTKQYPAYDDLYRYGFLHSRLKGYKSLGCNVDVYRVTQDAVVAEREFEGITVMQGDYGRLAALLDSGRYKQVLVHLLDKQMWQLLEPRLNTIKVLVWVHGAEIQVWQRRQFEFERFSAEEVERQKKLSDGRKNLWRSILQPQHANLQLIFVSDYFARESLADLELDAIKVRYHVIHNFIDDVMFKYVAKSPAQRTKILSIRPFSSRKYANDLTVNTILRLSHEPFFTELQFCLAGDGDLFDATVAPVRHFANVTVLKGFLRQHEIAALHLEYGVFLSPTRMDSQGVSRDEAMSSGMVPITTNVAAIPEFLDNSCGFAVPAEDSHAMAAAIEHLYHHPDVFSKLSVAAAKRVRRQCGFEQTIQQEIQLIQSDQRQ